MPFRVVIEEEKNMHMKFRCVVSTFAVAGCLLALTPSARAVDVPRNSVTVISNDVVTGSAALTKTGAGTLSLISSAGAGNTFSGDIVVDVDGGTLKIGGNGFTTGTGLQGLTLPLMTSANTLTVKRGGTFAIDDNAINGSTTYVADRLGSSGQRPAVSLAGGSLTLSGANYASVMTQTFGPLALSSGNSTLTSTRNGNGTPELIFSSLIPTSGAFANITGTALGSGTSDARILFTSTPDMLGGGGAAGTKTMSIVPRVRSTYDLVWYGPNGIRPLVAAEYNAVTGANDINAAGATENVKMTGTTSPFTALSADKTVNALVVNAAVNATWPMSKTLTLTSGQLIGGAANNSLNISSGSLTAGSGANADLDITIGQSTTTIGANIIDNGAGKVTLVKNGGGTLTLAQTTDNSYSGGTFVNEGPLNTGSTANRLYLGTGPVTVDNTTLTLGAPGATSFSTGDQASYTSLNGGQINLANAAYTNAGDRFDIRTGSILAGNATTTAGNGLNGLTRVGSLTGISGGQAVLAPGSTVAFGGTLTTGLGTGLLTLAGGVGSAADLYFGLAANAAAGSTLTVGSDTPWMGLSTDRSARSFYGTLTANSDFNLQGFAAPGGTPVTLTMGSTTAPVAINTPNGDVSVNVLGPVAWGTSSSSLGSDNRALAFKVNPGATFTLSAPDSLGASAGSTVGVTVQNGGTLAIGTVPNALNAATTVQAGGKLNATLDAGLTGSGALTFDPGSILDINSKPTAFSGSQAAAATVSPGTVVRLNVANVGSAVEPLDTYLSTKSPVFEVYGGNNGFANPKAGGTTILTLNQSAEGVGGLLVNDYTGRTLTEAVNGVIVIGANGGTIAATTNTTLTVPQTLALGANALTIGSSNLIDGVLLPKLGTVLLSASYKNTALPGSSITVIPGATLNNAANAIPDAADMTVNGTFTLGAAETIGSLAGGGLVNVANALTVGRNNNSTTFSGSLSGSGGLYKSGAGRLDLTGDATRLTHTGAIAVNEGVLALSDAGKFSNNSGTIWLNTNGTLVLDNSSTVTTGRLGTKAIALCGGTLSLVGNASSPVTETVGAVTPTQGDSILRVSGGTESAPATLVLTSGGTRAGSAILHYVGLDANNIIKYTTAPGMANGILPYGFVGNDFAVVANNTPVTAYSAYNTGDLGSYAGGTANFSLSGTQTPCTTSKSVNSVKMTEGLGITVSANTLSVSSGSIINDGGGDITGAGTIAAGSAVWTILNTGAMTISTPMTGTSGLVKLGGGILTMASPTTFTGTTYIDGGKLAYGVNDALNSQDLTVDQGAVLDFGAYNDTNLGTLTVKSGRVLCTGATSANSITQTSGKAITLGGGSSGSSASIDTGAGKWFMSGTTTFDSGNDPDKATIAGNLDLNGATRTFTVGNSMAAGAAVDLEVSAVVSGAASYGFSKGGAGIMKLSGTNTFDGPVAVGGGTLILGNSQALGLPTVARAVTVTSTYTLALDGGAVISSPNSTVSLDGTGDSQVGPVSGALVSLTGNNSLAGAVTLAGNSTVSSLKSGDKLTLAGAISGAKNLTLAGEGDTELSGVLGIAAGTLTKNGGGTLTLSGAGANTFTGATTVNGGKLVLDKSAGNAISSGAVTINNGALLQYAASSVNSDLIGSAAVTLNGAGQMDINGASDTIGNVAIVATGATADNTSILNSAGGGNPTLGTLGITPVAGYLTRIDSGSGTITLGGAVTFTAATTGRAKISGNLALGSATRTLTVGAGSGPDYDLDIDAAISGGTGVGLTNVTGRLRLSGANTYPGDTVISSGTLKIGNNDAIPSGAGKGNVTVTGTLDLNGFSPSVNGLLGVGTIDNNAPGASVLTVGANDQTSTFSGVIKNTVGSLGLTKTGTGTLPLSKANTFTGGVTINNGTVLLGHASGLGSDAAATVGFGSDTSSGRLTLNGFSPVIVGLNSFSTNAIVENNHASTASTLTINNATSNTFAGVLQNGAAAALALVKGGAGTLTLSGTNTYSGATTVNGGRLLLAGPNGAILSSSGLTLNSSGMLALTNNLSGNLANRLNNAATLAMNGGTLLFQNDGSAASFTEAVGPLSLIANANTITADPAAEGQTSSLTFSSLTRAGGSVNFTGNGLGESDCNRIFIGGLADGLIGLTSGLWATVNGTNYACYSAARGVYAFTAADSSSPLLSAAVEYYGSNDATFMYTLSSYGTNATSASVYLDISTQPDFSSIVTTSVANVSGVLPWTQLYDAAGLSASTTYYVRFRAVNMWGLEGVSAPVSFTTTEVANAYSINDLQMLVRMRLHEGGVVQLPALAAPQDYYRVLNDRIAALGADGVTVTAVEPGGTGIELWAYDPVGLTNWLSTTAAMIVVPEPVGNGRVFIFNENASAWNWNDAANWECVTDPLYQGYPDAIDDVAMILYYNQGGKDMTIGTTADPSVTVGELYAGQLKSVQTSLRLKGASSQVRTLNFARSNDEPARIQLTGGAWDIKTFYLNMGGSGSNDRLTLHAESDVVFDDGYAGVSDTRQRSYGQFKDYVTIEIPEGRFFKLIGGNPYNYGTAGTTFYISNSAKFVGSGILWNASKLNSNISGDFSEFTGTIRDSGYGHSGYDRNANWQFYTTSTTNATLELRGFITSALSATTSAGFCAWGTDHFFGANGPTPSRTPKKGLSLQGGMLNYRQDESSAWAGGVMTNVTDLLTVGKGLSFVYLSFRGPSAGYPTNTVFFPVMANADRGSLLLQEQNAYYNTNGYHQSRVYLGDFASHAVGGTGNPLVESTFPIIPWVIQRTNRNSGNPEFAAVDANGTLVYPVLTSTNLDTVVDSTVNAFCSGKSLALSSDRTVNSLLARNLATDANSKIGEGRTLTLSSGGLCIAGNETVRIGTQTGGAANGTLAFSREAYIFSGRTNVSDPAQIHASIVAPSGLAFCGYGNLLLSGDQTGINGEIVVNNGTLFLGSLDGTVPATVDVPVRVVGGNAKLTLKAGDPLNDQTLYFEDVGGFAAKLEPVSGGTNMVNKLYVDGVSVRRGVWGATGSGAESIDDAHFVGTGVVRVRKDDYPHPFILLIR